VDGSHIARLPGTGNEAPASAAPFEDWTTLVRTTLMSARLRRSGALAISPGPFGGA
jgi:hypothetical protein